MTPAAGQDRLGDQHRQRRHRLPRGARELGQVRQEPRLRDHPAGQRAERRRDPGKWAFAPSPTGADLPPLAEQDVIRTGFIYKPATVAPVGASKVLVGSARVRQRPRAAGPGVQEGRHVRQPRLSRSSSTTSSPRAPAADDGTGAGQRQPGPGRRRPSALVTFANQFKPRPGHRARSSWSATSTPTPTRTRSRSSTAAGYANLRVDQRRRRGDLQLRRLSGRSTTCSPTRRRWPMVTGATSGRSTPTSRSTTSTAGSTTTSPTSTTTSPFRVLRPQPGDRRHQRRGRAGRRATIQILATNDFHGRICRTTRPRRGGAAVLAGAVKQLRAENPDTVFAAAGDLIGASTFESFIAKDKPTIDALNEAGSRGVVGGQPRVRPGLRRPGEPRDAAVRRDDQPVRWRELAVHRGQHAQEDRQQPRAGRRRGPRTSATVKVGFVGAVTEHLPELVSPAGIADDQGDRHRQRGQRGRRRPQGRRRGRDRAAGPRGCAEHRLRRRWTTTRRRTSARSSTGSTTTSTRSSSGHTHLAYNCSFPVPAWVDDGRPVTERPVVSAGQYGIGLNKLVFTVDTATGQVRPKTQSILHAEARAPARTA